VSTVPVSLSFQPSRRTEAIRHTYVQKFNVLRWLPVAMLHHVKTRQRRLGRMISLCQLMYPRLMPAREARETALSMAPTHTPQHSYVHHELAPQ